MKIENIKATLQIGKEGITKTVIEQAKQQLKKRKIIKVKFLPTAIKDNKKDLVEELARKAGSKIIRQVGFTVILEKQDIDI